MSSNTNSNTGSTREAQTVLMDALLKHASGIKSLVLTDPMLQLPHLAGVREQLDAIAGSLTALQADVPLLQPADDEDSSRGDRPRTSA